MTTADLINLIIRKFGGERVEFGVVLSHEVTFTYGHHRYRSGFRNKSIFVREVSADYTYQIGDETQASQWIEGVLNGKTRNEEGVLE